MKMFEEQGFVVTPFDRCAMVLPGPNKGDPTEGIAVLDMDDGLEAGTERHDRALKEIARKITFGKVKAVAETLDGVLFNGRRWYQDTKEHHIMYDMSDFIRDRLGTIQITKTSRQKKKDKEPIYLNIGHEK